MTLFDLFILAVALSMDAMAVAICKGLSVQKLKFRHAMITGLYFGGFQALMPLLGYSITKLICNLFDPKIIQNIAPWVGFVLLCLIGANMIRESFGGAEKVDCSFCFKAMLPMAIATSIDALAEGVTLAMYPGINIAAAVIFIGVITLALSAVGVWIGHLFGAKFKSKAELTGGIILILMGIKLPLEHLGVFDWFFGLFK